MWKIRRPFKWGTWQTFTSSVYSTYRQVKENKSNQQSKYLFASESNIRNKVHSSLLLCHEIHFPSHASILYSSTFKFALMPTVFKFINEDSIGFSNKNENKNNDLSLISFLIYSKFLMLCYLQKSNNDSSITNRSSSNHPVK